MHDSMKPVHKVKVTNSKTEAIINNLESLVEKSNKLPQAKSPSPPPLPARPAGLTSRKAMMTATTNTGAPRSPATRSRNASGCSSSTTAGTGIVANAVRSLSQQFAQQQQSPRPVRPVKQPRRSTAMECSGSDEENEPSRAAVVGAVSKMAVRRSLPASGKAVATTTSIQTKTGRRSVGPLGVTSAVVAQQQDASSRVLRPRNQNSKEKDVAVVGRYPPRQSRLSASSTATSCVSTPKRKRRSSQDLSLVAAAAGISAAGGKRRSCRPLPSPPPNAAHAAMDAKQSAAEKAATTRSCAIKGKQRQELVAANKRPRFLRPK